jgi:hypothetical protein
MVWVDGVSYGDVFHQNEVEQSKYNFEIADIDVLFKQFDEAQAVNCETSMPFSQTSQPRPQAPSVGDSQLSSTKRTSCLVKSSPISLKDSKYKS